MATTHSFSSSFSHLPPPTSHLPLPSSPPERPPSPPPPLGLLPRTDRAAAGPPRLRPPSTSCRRTLPSSRVTSAIGQLSKPFTSGKDGRGGVVGIIRPAVRSGGMPSTHSAAVVAVTTSLGLERGFADSIFGMSVVFAAIVMYDTQGVRREVGNHARRLNKLWILRQQTAQNQEDDALVDSTSELPANREMTAELVSVIDSATSSQRSNTIPYSRHSSRTKSSTSNTLQSSEPERTELTELKQVDTEEFNQLSESVGHTELQVAVGALLGFVVSLAVYATL